MKIIAGNWVIFIAIGGAPLCFFRNERQTFNEWGYVNPTTNYMQASFAVIPKRFFQSQRRNGQWKRESTNKRGYIYRKWKDVCF